MEKNNKVDIKQGPFGIACVANMGNIIYNDRVYQVSNKVIPLFDQEFFKLPEEKGMFSVINVYYNLQTGDFIFHQLGMYKEAPGFINSEVKTNVFPVAQFMIEQDLSSFIVHDISEFTEMATYAVSSSLLQGVTGLQGPQGEPGITGLQGYQGITGPSGVMGPDGDQGITGIGPIGAAGTQGVTGLGYDFTYLLNVGFESNRVGVIDRSPYERDCVFRFDGTGGYTGWIGVTGSVTGIQDSKFTKTVGIIGTAHEVTFAGGFSEYRRDEYLPFSGVISCWMNLNQRPRALFSYEVLNLEVSFTDESILFPSEWLWYFGDGKTSELQNPTYSYDSPGTYIVTLKVSNENGESYRYAEVTVELPEE